MTRRPGVELYREGNRLIMDFLPGVPYVHTEPALAFREAVSGFEPGPLANETFTAVSVE